MVESLIERLQGAISPNLNEIFFGSSSTPPSRNVRRKIRSSRLPPKRGIHIYEENESLLLRIDYSLNATQRRDLNIL